jgi:hypothetical protein
LSSPCKISANRANSRASTGPKTAAGRNRSGKNALRHGLSLPVSLDPQLAEEVEGLAREIAGPGANAEVQDRARAVAEAQIDLRHIRSARHQFLCRALNDPHYDSRGHDRQNLQHLGRILRGKSPDMSEAQLNQLALSSLDDPTKLATFLSQEAKSLLAMDRYERRALSRRKFAIRSLDEARRRK